MTNTPFWFILADVPFRLFGAFRSPTSFGPQPRSLNRLRYIFFPSPFYLFIIFFIGSKLAVLGMGYISLSL